MKKNRIGIILVLLLVLWAAGCGADEGTKIPNDVNPENPEQGVVIQQYFGSAAYVYDGQDEENGELMPPVEATLNLKEGENVYAAAINSLKTLPEGQDQYITMMEEQFTLNDVTVVDGVAYVDFASENLSGGSLNETVLIDQIVYTLSNSFEEIAAVKFTVDGQQSETLMGHCIITEEFVADYL